MIEKFLWQPVSPFAVSQGFGEDKVCISNADNKTLVTKATPETCPVGFRSIYANTNGHNGLDIPASRWQRVYAAHDGIVTEVQTEIERGLGIGIVTSKKYFCQETGKEEHFKTRYWHFIALDVYKGEKVKVGDFIGHADSTGYSTGDHLHLELKPVTITSVNTETGIPNYSNTLQNNSHLGAINPIPYLNNTSALQIAGIIRQISELTATVADFIADWTRK